IRSWVQRVGARGWTIPPAAPAGNARRKNGNVDAVCVSATNVGPAPSETMSHAAPTLCMNAPMSETTSAIRRLLKSGLRRGLHKLGRLSIDRAARAVVVETICSTILLAARQERSAFPALPHLPWPTHQRFEGEVTIAPRVKRTDQQSREEHQRAADTDLHGGREGRRFHVAVPKPADRQQFDQHDGDRDNQRDLK